MSETNWLPRITKCDEVYYLDLEDDPAEGTRDIVLALTDKNGRQHRLSLSDDACSSLYDLLTTALQSPNSPLRSPDKGKAH